MTFTIITDTREQKPYRWDTPAERGTLKAGDYSVKGLEDRIAIERKSLIDAYGTFGKGRERFQRELEKLAGYEYAAVVIEATMLQALRPPENFRSSFNPKSFNRSWIAWAQRYGVHFMFCGGRELAQRQVYIMLERFWRDVQEGKR